MKIRMHCFGRFGCLYVRCTLSPSNSYTMSSVHLFTCSVRYGVLQRLPAVDALTTEYKEAMLNRSKIQFLTFRSKVNDHAASISQELAELNALAIAINRRILEANEEIRQFNATIIDDNATLFEQCTREPPSAEQNGAIISGNLAMLRDLVSHASANATAIDQLLLLTENNNIAASENTQAIAQNRHDMLEFNRIIFESRQNQSSEPGRDNSAVNQLMQASIGNFFPA